MSVPIFVLTSLCIVLAIALAIALVQFFRVRNLYNTLDEQYKADYIRYKPIKDVEEVRDKLIKRFEEERAKVHTVMQGLKKKYEHAVTVHEKQKKKYKKEGFQIMKAIASLKKELQGLDEEAYVMDVGFYKPKYAFESSERYKRKLDDIRAKQKALIKQRKAVVAHAEMTVGGSKSEGRKFINDSIKLILRAFNGECDAAVAKVKYSNVHVMEKRIKKACDTLNKLGRTKSIEITQVFLKLKLSELYLTHEFHEKKQAEAEEQRRIREQMREEERVQKEIEKAKKEAEREETQYMRALEKARKEAQEAAGEKQALLQREIEKLQLHLQDAQSKKERAISRAQQTKSGHVYIISNIGSFGENVFKIGMTRRLDPMERVKELGDASVPFRFDVHAIIYSENAPALENELHKVFDRKRLNRINNRKEFFRVSLEEIEKIVHTHNANIEFTKIAEAQEYRKSMAMIREELQTDRQPKERKNSKAEIKYALEQPQV